MPSRLGPRFLIEAAFLILVAVGVGFADLSTKWIVLVMAGAWLLTAAVEWLAARLTRIAFPARAAVHWPGEDVSAPVVEPPPSPEEPALVASEVAQEEELVPPPVGWQQAPPEAMPEPQQEVAEKQPVEEAPAPEPVAEEPEEAPAPPEPEPIDEAVPVAPRRRPFWRRALPPADGQPDVATPEAEVEAPAAEAAPEEPVEGAELEAAVVEEPAIAEEAEQPAEPEPVPEVEPAAEEEVPRRRRFWSRRRLPDAVPEQELEEAGEQEGLGEPAAEPAAEWEGVTVLPASEPAEPEAEEQETPEPVASTAASTEETPSDEPVAPVEAELEEDLWQGEAEPARTWSLDDTLSEPAPAAEPADVAAPEPADVATPPEPAREPARSSRPRLLRRHPQPREWNVWELERAVREHAEADPRRRREWNVTLGNLRQYANRRGALPVEFDPLVRETFRELIDSGDRV